MRTVYFDDAGHLDQEGVAYYVDALRLKRTTELPEKIRAHVAGCQRCRGEITGLFSLLERVDKEEARTAGGVARRVTRSVLLYRIAAAFVAIVGIGALLYSLLNRPGNVKNPGEPTAVVNPAERTPLPGSPAQKLPPAGEIAANYRPDPELEGLMGSETRGVKFEAFSPPERVAGGHTLSFRWSQAGGGPWTLVVMNNRGDVLKSVELRRPEFLWKGPVKPALYYWKVIGDDELLHVGKVRVE